MRKKKKTKRHTYHADLAEPRQETSSVILRKDTMEVYQSHFPRRRTLDICDSYISPGYNQIWICNFLQCDWSRPQPKH